MKPHNVFLTESEKRVFAAINPELYAEQIAELANVDVQTVYRTVRKFDLVIKKFKRELTEEQKDAIRSMASPKTGVKAIRDVVGSTRFQIEAFMDSEGLPRKRSMAKEPCAETRPGIFNPDLGKKDYTWLV